MDDFQKLYEIKTFSVNTKLISQFWQDVADLGFMQFALEQTYASVESLALAYGYNPKSKQLSLMLFQVYGGEKILLYTESIHYHEPSEIVETRLNKVLHYMQILQIEYRIDNTVNFQTLMKVLVNV